MKKLVVILLVLALIFTTGCGKSSSTTETKSSAEPLDSNLETVEGYYTTKIETPDWLAWGVHQKYDPPTDTYGDNIWMCNQLPDGTPIAACYNTIDDTWEYYAFETGGIESPYPWELSVTDGAVWAMYKEDDSFKYYVCYINLNTGEKLCEPIPFSGDAGSESPTAIFSGLIAIDEDTALLETPTNCYVVDKELNVLSRLGHEINNVQYKLDDVCYIHTENGLAPFDPKTQSFGQPLEFDIISSSNNGKYVVSVGSTGCGYYDPATGITTELFDWWDVALTESAAFGEACALVNSNGDFITMDEYSMSRVSKGLVPVKKTLTLASFGDSNYMGYNADDELIDIILAFNSSNSEYKIEIKPMSYSTEDEKNKLLIELATSTDIDLVDTSILPENAINGGVLVDLLPYIDADEDISREDFIEPLLNAMLKNGALYEYTSKYSLLTMFTPAELYPGDENWTAENIKQILADNPGQEAYMHNYDRDDIVKMYTWAAIGEFIDWDSNSCSFDSQAFMDWLTLMRDLPVKQEYSGSDKDLLGISYAAEDEVRYLRYNGYDQYVIAGFPESQTNGCYFMLTGADLNEWMGDSYSGCRIGIMAASSNKDAAWSFVKLLMQGKDRPSLLDGIPVVKASFEKAVDRITRDTVLQGDNFVLFSTEDAKQFKDAVYSTTKMARIDEKLVKLITTEINGYIAGDKTAEDTAAQIQSKVSIYLAEQS